MDIPVFGYLDDPKAHYDFNDICVWINPSGELFYACDSGCSCPMPFEWCKTEADAELISLGDGFDSFERVVMSHPADHGEKIDLLNKVKKHLESK